MSRWQIAVAFVFIPALIFGILISAPVIVFVVAGIGLAFQVWLGFWLGDRYVKSKTRPKGD